MILDVVSAVALAFATIPCGMFVWNLRLYRPLNRKSDLCPLPLSVLIPARNEEANISAAIESVLANRNCEFEILVLDDQSTDGTAEIVREFAARDSRVRLEAALDLPPGWCGKQHACRSLAQLARNPLLVFIDADVRLQPDSLARIQDFMEESGCALASGVPFQELETFLEKLLIPLIHFILLGFLSLQAMRRSRKPEMSAGCGQLFVARRDAYRACGGHAMIKDSLHDGVKLPRVFRKAGYTTELFDATDIASCRMYRTNAQVWSGLGKNATEGLAAPALIIPATLALFAGQVMPFILLTGASRLSIAGLILCVVAVCFAYIPRILAVRRFRQPFLSALLHPVGILGLLLIQWRAFLLKITGRPCQWKGRAYLTPNQLNASEAL